jgi:hypothetical protein
MDTLDSNAFVADTAPSGYLQILTSGEIFDGMNDTCSKRILRRGFDRMLEVCDVIRLKECVFEYLNLPS